MQVFFASRIPHDQQNNSSQEVWYILQQLRIVVVMKSASYAFIWNIIGSHMGNHRVALWRHGIVSDLKNTRGLPWIFTILYAI